MVQFNREFFTRLLNILLVIALVVALLGVIVDLKVTLKHGGMDLRNRVVGARLLVRGLDPYHFKWQPGDSEMLKDPLDKPELPVSRVTVPPSGLMLYVPFANLPYFQQRLIWLILQFLALVASLWLVIRSEKRYLHRKFLLMVGLLVFADGVTWRLHIEVGQTYIFYVLLMAISYWLLSRKMKFNHEAAGLLLGLTISMRFPLIVIILPMILFKKVRLLATTLLGCLIWLSVFVAAFGHQVWANYFIAMKTINQLSIGELRIATSELNLPQTLEGILFGIPNRISSVNSSIPIQINRILNLQIPTSFVILILAALLLLYSKSILDLYQIKSKKLQVSILDATFIFSGLMLLLVDFWMPSPRQRYNDIFFLIPLLLMLKYVYFRMTHLYLIGLFGIGFLLTNDLFNWIPRAVFLGQLLMLSASIAISLVILLPPAVETEPASDSTHLHT